MNLPAVERVSGCGARCARTPVRACPLRILTTGIVAA
jgi:hypothetical protein